MRGLSILFMAVVVGLAVGCGGRSGADMKAAAPAKKPGYVNAIYPQAIARRR